MVGSGGNLYQRHGGPDPVADDYNDDESSGYVIDYEQVLKDEDYAVGVESPVPMSSIHDNKIMS